MAVYTLSHFGVDTVATDRFRVVRDSGHCLVKVTVSFQIFRSLLGSIRERVARSR